MPTQTAHRISGAIAASVKGKAVHEETGEEIEIIEIVLNDMEGNLYTMLVPREVWEEVYASTHEGIVVATPAMAASIKTKR